MPVVALLVLALFQSFSTATPGDADPIENGSEHCVVNVPIDDRLNLRTGPGTGAEILALLSRNACGLIITGDCRGSWCPVEDGHHAGWVHRRYVAVVPETEFCLATAAQRAFRSVRA